VSVSLLDVNVLIALLDPAHPNHEDAHAWYGVERKRGWATCPITIAGCIRVLSNPAYPSVQATAGDVIRHLRAFCTGDDHEFWRDGVSLLDDKLFRPEYITGHQKVTDVLLVGLAVRHKGKLATFDRAIPLKTVIGAKPEHLQLLG
jgi:uncharacterized protein